MKSTITESDVTFIIDSAEYLKLGEKTTVCFMKLKNGFEIVGSSSCVDPENYDDEVGAKYAFEQARNKVWELLGFELQSKLAANG